jgi:hypothetical protein
MRNNDVQRTTGDSPNSVRLLQTVLTTEIVCVLRYTKISVSLEAQAKIADIVNAKLDPMTSVEELTHQVNMAARNLLTEIEEVGKPAAP